MFKPIKPLIRKSFIGAVLIFKNEACIKKFLNSLDEPNASYAIARDSGIAVFILPPVEDIPFAAINTEKIKSETEGLLEVLVGNDAAYMTDQIISNSFYQPKTLAEAIDMMEK